MKTTIKYFWVTFLLLINTSITSADTPQATVEALATKDLLAVGYLDLNSVDTKACLKWAEQQKMVAADETTKMRPMAGMAQELIHQATEVGADHIIALVEQEDLKAQGPPLIAITIAEGKVAKEAIKSLRQMLSLLQIPNFELEVWNNCILAGSAKQLSRAKANAAVERPNLAKAWQKFSGHGAGVMIVANGDTRRVVRELLPKLESPYEKITGKLIADNLTSIGCAIDLPKDIGAKLVVQSTDEPSATVVQEALASLKKMLTDGEGEYSALVPAIGVKAISAVEPMLDGNDVVLDLAPLLDDQVMLMTMLAPLRSGSRQTQRQNNMRQIILAMHNYESAVGSLPTYANFDAQGKPLLSWRVHLLPFLEQSNLYKQFKLDEPWDSPHNLKLVTTIPAQYIDPSTKMDHLHAAGKTRIAVPFAEGTMFNGNQGTKWKEVKDGTSATIAIATVTPDQAVVWTQPVDWNVDLKNPKEGILNEENPEVLMGKADGSIDVLNISMQAEKLRALLTIDGGEAP